MANVSHTDLRRRTSAKVTVDDLLDAAGLAFERCGVAQATMVDVAHQAGCSRATLYRNFANREALHLAFVHRATLRIAAVIAPRRAPQTPRAMVDLIVRGINAVRADPLLAVWFEPNNMAIPIALSQNSELLHAMTTGLAGELDRDSRPRADIELLGAWVLRCIVSMLAMPGESEEQERAMLETFVVPLLLPLTPSPHLTPLTPDKRADHDLCVRPGGGRLLRHRRHDPADETRGGGVMTDDSFGDSLDDIDLTDASVWERGAPHEWLDRLRTESPVHWHKESDGPGFWALTRHDDVRRVSTSPGEFSSWVGGPLRLDMEGDALDQLRMVIIGMDPPDHRDFRTIVSRAFTPKMIARLEESLRVETARVVGELRDGTSCEFVADVAARIPMWSISELMGVPPEDRHRLYELSHALIDDQDPEIAPTPETAMESSAEIFAYALEMAARERANPSGSLTSTLLEAEVNGRRLDDMEFTLFFMFLIVAGNETTRTASSHGLLSLLDHPESLDRLVRDPGLMPSAVEEILRWQPPIQHFRRTATTDLVLGGQPIAEGDKVLMWYAGSNRDPSVFADPHRFLIDRSPNPQQSFGIGAHFCLGANLARVSLHILFSELLGTIENIGLEAPPRRLHSNLINGIKEMRISYDVR